MVVKVALYLTDNPVYVSRSDLLGVIYRHDGSAWMSLGDVDVADGIKGASTWTIVVVHARRNGRLVDLAAGFSTSVAASFVAWQESVIATLPAGIRPAKDTNGMPIALQTGFQANVKANGNISLQCGGVAATFPTGSWNMRLRWAI